MSMHTHASSKASTAIPSLTPVRSNLLQRKCACGGSNSLAGSCGGCKEKTNELQRRAIDHRAANLTAPPIVNQVLRSPGQPLGAETRSFFESRFGHDFGNVRVHTDARAVESARAVNALAYTVGREIVFGEGHYEPQTVSGRLTLAHELTHVVQQSQMPRALPAKLTIGPTDDPYEREADAVARQVVAHDSSTPFVNAEARGRSDVQDAPARTLPDAAAPVNRVETVEPTIRRAVVGASDAPPVSQSKLNEFRLLIFQYRTLAQSGKLSAEEVAEVNQAIEKANAALFEAEKVAGAGSSTKYASGAALAATLVLAADDATIIGVFDDVAIPFTLVGAGLLAIGAVILRSSEVEIRRTGQAAQDAVADAVVAIGLILLAQKVGDQVRGLAGQIAVHLARILGKTVSGKPPDHQNDPKQDKPHWWLEIKNWIKQINKKGLSPRQLMRELRKRFSEEQLNEIREAIRQAAKELGEDPPDFPPVVGP